MNFENFKQQNDTLELKVNKQYQKLLEKHDWQFNDENGQIRDINGVEIKNAITDIFESKNNIEKEENMEKLQALIDEAIDIKRKNESIKEVA